MLILIVCMVTYAAALQIAFGQELFDYNNMPNAMQSMCGRSSGTLISV